ncbi:CPK2, partial [Symbiodinium necroappetens]
VSLLVKYGTGFFTGRTDQPVDDEEAARLCTTVGKLDHLRCTGSGPSTDFAPAPPVGTFHSVKEDALRRGLGQQPACYGRANKPTDISFTSAAFVCFAAKRLRRAGRRVAESLRGVRPPMPPPSFPPPDHEPAIQRVPSFYSIDTAQGVRESEQEPKPTSLTGRMAGLISGHAADWAALTVAGLAAGTLADPNGREGSSSILRLTVDGFNFERYGSQRLNAEQKAA